jgi:hypothetical protein
MLLSLEIIIDSNAESNSLFLYLKNSKLESGLKIKLSYCGYSLLNFLLIASQQTV